MKRVNEGRCKANLTAPFTKILHSINRMGNSCVNMADAAINDMNFKYFISNGEEETEKAE